MKPDFGPAPTIGIFRALVLGDVLCAVPAMRALRRALPAARLAFIGLPWASALIDRLDGIDDFVPCCGVPGLPETGADFGALPGFLASMQARRFDLLLQLHGSGGIVNPLLAACGPRTTAGFAESGGYAQTPALHTAWPTAGHEIERMLAATDHLGMPRDGMQLEYPVRSDDRARLAAEIDPLLDGRPLVCVHAGAQLPSRRWPAERFGEVARRLHDTGSQVVLTGSPGEADVVRIVRRVARRPLLDLVGRTDLWTLGALLERCALVVCNDTGISHVAAALRRPSVVVSSGADVARWAPLDHTLHRVVWADVACRPCGHANCPTGHECARAVAVDDVWRAIETLAARRLPNEAQPA